MFFRRCSVTRVSSRRVFSSRIVHGQQLIAAISWLSCHHDRQVTQVPLFFAASSCHSHTEIWSYPRGVDTVKGSEVMHCILLYTKISSRKGGRCADSFYESNINEEDCDDILETKD